MNRDTVAEKHTPSTLFTILATEVQELRHQTQEKSDRIEHIHDLLTLLIGKEQVPGQIFAISKAVERLQADVEQIKLDMVALRIRVLG